MRPLLISLVFCTTIMLFARHESSRFHPSTIYFPTNVKKALMIEPSESKETLDAFIEAMIEISEQAMVEPDTLKNAPITTPVSRPNETAAAKNPNIASL